MRINIESSILAAYPPFAKGNPMLIGCPVTSVTGKQGKYSLSGLITRGDYFFDQDFIAFKPEPYVVIKQ